MREILFRGKRVDNGEWVEGQYYKRTEYYGDPSVKYYIITSTEDLDYDQALEYYEVFPETIGQFTGLLDKNGKKIFEGDIISTRKHSIRTKKLKGYFGLDSDGYPQKIPGYEGESEYHYTCLVDGYALVEFSPTHGYYLHGTSMFIDAICNEIVGNIHDNPELLK